MNASLAETIAHVEALVDVAIALRHVVTIRVDEDRAVTVDAASKEVDESQAAADRFEQIGIL
jgi:hypothetical protein